MNMTGREPHPLLPLLTADDEALWPVEEVAEFYDLRRQALAQAQFDPLIYGYEPPVWTLADERMADLRRRFPTGVLLELDLGGNRAGKTERRAKRMTHNLVTKPGWKAWALQSNQTSSRQNQQSVIYKYLPPEWKPASGKMRGGAVTKIVYSIAGGFTEDVLVCPNSSECRFKFYGMDVGGVEGAELDEAWGDELITLDWIEALIFRLVTRNGTLGITFTPIEGYSSTVKAILDGAATIEEAVAELLPLRDATGKETGHETVPRVQENLHAVVNGQMIRSTIVYFHTADNPFGNYPSMKETLDGAHREKILVRAYGVPTKAAGAQFPLFRDAVHVVSLNFFREVEKLGVTRYFLSDPTPGNKNTGRNWYMVWLALDRLGRRFYYREWPSHGHIAAYVPGVGDMGPWAVPGRAEDGEKGPAQQSLGWSLTRYRDEILRMEGGEEILERWMDSRYGNAPTAQKEESTTLIRMMADLKMDFLAAPGDAIGEGIELINSALYYDIAQPVSPTNQPGMYVVETCPNLIFSLKNWTGRDGQHGATKDPIDLCRYAEGAKLRFVDRELMTIRQPWMEQFKR